MRKISFSIISSFLSILSLFSQNENRIPKNTENEYIDTKLKFDQANILYSYYTQDGNNSAVSGGQGSEKLEDYSTNIKLNFNKKTKQNLKHNFDISLGVDYYTSASSDMIDNLTNTSASYSDIRIYPSLNYSLENIEKKESFGGGILFSSEFDYMSLGASIFANKNYIEKGTNLIVKSTIYFDELKNIYPIEFRPRDDKYTYTKSSRNTIDFNFTLQQIINSRMQMAFSLEPVFQFGVLHTPFNRVSYTEPWDEIKFTKEILPEQRFKIPVSTRLNYRINNKLTLRSFYRFYFDNWDIFSSTLNLEMPIKINDELFIIPGGRIYIQSKSKYYFPFGLSTDFEKYKTNDPDLSTFTAYNLNLGIKINPKNGLIFEKINSLELKYLYYNRSNGLQAHNITFGLWIK